MMSLPASSKSLPGVGQLDTLLGFLIEFCAEVTLLTFPPLANRRGAHVHLSGHLAQVVVVGNG